MRKLLVGLVVGAACAGAQAEFFDGNKLLAKIKGDAYDYVNAVGYIMGVSDATRGITHCPQENVTAGQMTEMLKNHLEALPSVRHLPADQHVTYVLKNNWPCLKKGTGV